MMTSGRRRPRGERMMTSGCPRSEVSWIHHRRVALRKESSSPITSCAKLRSPGQAACSSLGRHAHAAAACSSPRAHRRERSRLSSASSRTSSAGSLSTRRVWRREASECACHYALSSSSRAAASAKASGSSCTVSTWEDTSGCSSSP